MRNLNAKVLPKHAMDISSIFPTLSKLEYFLQLRSSYIYSALRVIMAHWSHMTVLFPEANADASEKKLAEISKYMVNLFSLFEASIERMAARDVQCETEEQLADMYTKLAEGAQAISAKAAPVKPRTEGEWIQVLRGLVSALGRKKIGELREEAAKCNSMQQTSGLSKEECIDIISKNLLKQRKAEETKLIESWSEVVQNFFQSNDTADPEANDLQAVTILDETEIQNLLVVADDGMKYYPCMASVPNVVSIRTQLHHTKR